MHTVAASTEIPLHLVASRTAPARAEDAPFGTTREITFARDRSLFSDGDEATYFYEIVRGTVRCCRLTPDGRRQIYRFVGAGEMLGLSGDQTHSYSAEAVTQVVVRRHPLTTLDAAMAVDAGLRRRVLQALRDELSAVRNQMVLLGRMTATERIATFLTGLAARSDADDGTLNLPMTRSDIADHLGLTLETVSRKIGELKRLGLIELETPTRLRILDPEAIEAIAEAA